jgi:hypothetical protein
MMLLDSERLAALEDEFNEYPKGIKLITFIWLMECAIHYPPEEKVDLVCGLVKLFNDIDINGDKHMEWSEFTQYIIDTVLADKGGGQAQLSNDTKHEQTENDILDQAYARRSKRYQLANIQDRTLHPSLIKRIKHIYGDLLLVLEESSCKLKVYQQNLEIKLTVESVRKSKFEEKGFILDIAYSQDQKLIGAVTSDRKILFWDAEKFSPSEKDKVSKRPKYIHEMKRLLNGIWYMKKENKW